MRQIKATKETLYFQKRKRTETANKRKVKRKLKIQEGGKARKVGSSPQTSPLKRGTELTII